MIKPKIGITVGDVNGIGPEVIIKALDDLRICDTCTPVIYASSKVISYHKNIIKPHSFSFLQQSSGGKAQEGKVNLVNCWDENVNIELGAVTETGGKYAHIALDRAVRELKDGEIDGLVTAPIHKQAMKMSNFPYDGHTEYLEDQIAEGKSLMTMVKDDLRIALVTNHTPISQVASMISEETITSKLTLFEAQLKRDFYIDKPIIAVLGLNPHAGDGGVLGSEDDEIIRPVIERLQKQGGLFYGPFPADGFFGSGEYKKYDGIMAMYHDQGLVPFKLLSFGQGTNVTGGLPVIRTSVDHGTAMTIAGQNQADASSMRAAIFTAIDIVRNRRDFDESSSNPLVRKKKREERYQA